MFAGAVHRSLLHIVPRRRIRIGYKPYVIEGVGNMNLAQSERLLCGQTQEYLKTIYLQSKITGSVQINFVAAKLGLPSASAVTTAQFLQQTGMIDYEKYGRIKLTDEGKRFAHSILIAENATNPP